MLYPSAVGERIKVKHILSRIVSIVSKKHLQKEESESRDYEETPRNMELKCD